MLTISARVGIVDPHNALAQARSLLRAGRPEGAVALLEETVREYPSYADVHHQLGVALGIVGESLRAEGHLRRALEQNPRYAEAHLNLSILLSDRGAYEEARLHLKSFNELTVQNDGRPPAAALDDLVRRHVELALRYRAYGMLEAAEEQTRQALRLRPEYQDLQLRLAELLFERSQLQESARLVEEILHQRPHYDAAHLLRARIQKEQGELQAARRTLSQVRRGTAAVQARTLARGLQTRETPGHDLASPPSPRTEA
jgi:tetratricopeptide (TPR) repeat protein